MNKKFYLIDEFTHKLTLVDGKILHDGMFVYLDENGKFQIAEEFTGLNVGFAMDTLEEIEELCDLHVNRLTEFRKTNQYKIRVEEFVNAKKVLLC